MEHFESTQQESNESSDVKQRLISNEKFQLLRECQQLIYSQTDVSPSIRKILSELITDENMDKVSLHLIKSLNS